MKNIKLRILISVLITIISFWGGYFLLDSMIAIGDICIALIYVGAIIAGGSFWIGSKR